MNTQTQEALKMAISAMQVAASQTKLNFGQTIQACKEALEQPLTRDWKETIDERIAKDDKFKDALAQPAQDFFERGKEIARWADKQNEQPTQEPYKFIHPYYGNLTEMLPTKKELIAPSWQGLTSKEVEEIEMRSYTLQVSINDYEFSTIAFYEAIEQALKEKNHG